MDWKDNRTLKHSFFSAMDGILVAFKEERNLRIHLIAAIIVINLGFIFNLSVTEWLVCLLLIGSMVALELLNSAIENVVDLTTNYQKNPLAKKAKDMAAGAVFFMAIISAVIGCIIFLPYIF